MCHAHKSEKEKQRKEQKHDIQKTVESLARKKTTSPCYIGSWHFWSGYNRLCVVIFFLSMMQKILEINEQTTQLKIQITWVFIIGTMKIW